MKLEVRKSGPIRVAEVDCHDCPNPRSLNSPSCRRCVFEGLASEGEVERVVLKHSYRRVYLSPDLSRLGRALAVLGANVRDRTFYAPSEERDRCKKCVDKRMRKLEALWPKIMENPHDLSPLDKLASEAAKREDECAKCTSRGFMRLLKGIKKTLESIPSYKLLASGDYDKVFRATVVPFFVEGAWIAPRRRVELIDSYQLPGSRGEVRIYRQHGRPVKFYYLDLPEFKLPAEHVKLLYEAFRMELKGAPPHARFAYPSRMLGFAEEWYETLLYLARERFGVRASSEELRKLAKLIANWLTYRVLEPLSHDEYITDIYIDAPPELQPIRVIHEKWGECETGIYWTSPSLLGLGEILASRLGRAFDEPHPQLDVEIPELGLRLFVSRYPAIWDRDSISMAIRKRRSKPWTQPLFLDRGSLTPLASSVVSNLIRRGASAFCIGDIGTAKTSYLETQIPEIGPHQRIICYQDTEELHIEDFVKHGYDVENVRVADPEHLQKQIDAFLRGGAAYWLITEVRSMEAVKSALGAAARRGSQPVLSTFHVRTKRQMYDLVCNIMGLHEAAYKYVDLIISTAKFDTPHGTIRRVVEISEVLKEWSGNPEYVELFTDDRRRDILMSNKIFTGDRRLVSRLNSRDLSKIDPVKASKKIDFLSPSRGGSNFIPDMCRRLAIDERELIVEILTEARIKSDLLNLSRNTGDQSYLELPFVSEAYNFYFAAIEQNAPDYKQVLKEWQNWLEERS